MSRNQLGLVCITTSEDVRFRTITRTRLRALAADVQETALRELYADNIRRLSQAIAFCLKNDLRLYRITSGLFPQSEEPPGHDILEEFAGELARVGARAKRAGLRLVMHPDQFVVLSSDQRHVVENSVTILSHHARVLDLLRQPRSPWAALQIHGGKGDRADALVREVRALPDGVRTRLVLENDEHAYRAVEILDVCQRAAVPMVFDAHHHVCHEELESYDDPDVARYTELARETWPDPAWQIVHISNGRESFRDPKHADFIEVMPAAFREVPWIEVEAKQKELAIARLRPWLRGAA
jgi:UV DNA damage endonuclease